MREPRAGMHHARWLEPAIADATRRENRARVGA